MAAVTLPTHYRNVFAELGYAQAEIDARIENANYGSAIDHLKYRHDEFHLVPVLDESGNIAGRNFIGQYRIILSADTASEVRQMLSQKRR